MVFIMLIFQFIYVYTNLLIGIVNSQTILQKASGARKNSVQEMQKVGTLDTKVNGHSIQPVSSSAQITEMTAVEDHTKVSRINVLLLLLLDIFFCCH